MKYLILILVFFLCSNPASATSMDYSDFSKIPVLQNGRIKPLDSFAKHYLKIFSGKESLKGTNSSQWLASVIFGDQKAQKQQLFKISNPDVLHALKLKRRKGLRYTFIEVFDALATQVDTLYLLYQEKPKDLSLAQRQLLELHKKMDAFTDLNSSFDEGQSTLLKIIPPQWSKDQETWLTPKEMFKAGEGSPTTAEYLRLWMQLGKSYQTQNKELWGKTSQQAFKKSSEISNTPINLNKLKLEVAYNRISPFTKSLIFYMGSLLILITGYIFKGINKKYAYISLAIGWALHLGGIITRMIIMGRPPVTNLYESIIFVGMIAVLSGLITEKRRNNGVGLIIATLAGVTLQFLGLKYAAEGDTLGMLVAVLDTNFWLATHVVTITIGYGCALMAGTMAHIYLLSRAFKPNRHHFHFELDKSIKTMCLTALFFATLGTLLGGIWADQSWGRFWGWDPKENGALLIVLWLIFLVHSRITGQLTPLSFTTGMVLTNVIVALAWFGVNLLNVGLHSYGFTENIAINLGLFTGGEVLFAIILFVYIKYFQKKAISV